MEKQSLVLVILLVLLLITAVQAVQLGSLASKVSGTVGVSTNVASASLPQSLQNLPNMVGGC